MAYTFNISLLSVADFSNAVQVTKDSPMRSDIAGVVFWQASLHPILFTSLSI